jgi:hypothetical protein
VFRLLPREEKFFDLFEQQAGHIVSAARVLEELALDYPDAKAKAQRIKDLEHAGDALSTPPSSPRSIARTSTLSRAGSTTCST